MKPTERGCGNENTAEEPQNTKQHVTEVEIGNTLFVVTSECSPSATETLEQKLLRMMRRHVCGTG